MAVVSCGVDVQAVGAVFFPRGFVGEGGVKVGVGFGFGVVGVLVRWSKVWREE